MSWCTMYISSKHEQIEISSNLFFQLHILVTSIDHVLFISHWFGRGVLTLILLSKYIYYTSSFSLLVNQEFQFYLTITSVIVERIWVNEINGYWDARISVSWTFREHHRKSIRSSTMRWWKIKLSTLWVVVKYWL